MISQHNHLEIDVRTSLALIATSLFVTAGCGQLSSRVTGAPGRAAPAPSAAAVVPAGGGQPTTAPAPRTASNAAPPAAAGSARERVFAALGDHAWYSARAAHGEASLCRSNAGLYTLDNDALLGWSTNLDRAARAKEVDPRDLERDTCFDRHTEQTRDDAGVVVAEVAGVIWVVVPGDAPIIAKLVYSAEPTADRAALRPSAEALWQRARPNDITIDVLAKSADAAKAVDLAAARDQLAPKALAALTAVSQRRAVAEREAAAKAVFPLAKAAADAAAIKVARTSLKDAHIDPTKIKKLINVTGWVTMRDDYGMTSGQVLDVAVGYTTDSDLCAYTVITLRRDYLRDGDALWSDARLARIDRPIAIECGRIK